MGIFPIFWEESALKKLVNYMGEENPFFSIKRKLLRVSQFVSPKPSPFPKERPKGAALWKPRINVGLIHRK